MIHCDSLKHWRKTLLRHFSKKWKIKSGQLYCRQSKPPCPDDETGAETNFWFNLIWSELASPVSTNHSESSHYKSLNVTHCCFIKGRNNATRNTHVRPEELPQKPVPVILLKIAAWGACALVAFFMQSLCLRACMVFVPSPPAGRHNLYYKIYNYNIFCL